MFYFPMYLMVFVYGAVLIFFMAMTYRLIKAVEKIAALLESQHK